MVSSLYLEISDLRLPRLSEARIAVLIDKIVHLGLARRRASGFPGPILRLPQACHGWWIM
jgi:hypothetical protein